MDDNTPSAAAPSLCTYQSNDANKHAANLTKWAQEYDQFSCGRFYGCINEVQLSQVRVFKEFTNQVLRQQCNIQTGGIWLGLSVDNKPCRINGHLTTSADIMCRPGQRDFALMTPEDFSIFGIVVEQAALQQAAEVQRVEINAEMLDSLTLQGLPMRSVTGLRYFIGRFLASDLLAVTSKIQQDIIIAAVIELLTANQPVAARQTSYQRRKTVVETIIQYIEAGIACSLAETITSPITITELCAIANVSRRTLQYSFESILGVSPQRFIRLTRLNQIRRELSDPHETRPIADIAFNYGFYHPGLFAHNYKLLFGENPSMTLQRCRLSAIKR
jgi:AraC family ethanolamine operon transcriptional activator